MQASLRSGFSKAFAALMLMSGIVAWWLVLAHKSRQVAQEESNRQTHLLMREIESHRQTDEALQDAKLLAERAKQAAEAANQAKSRYISAISHELRTPLNSILGYAQLMGEDASIPAHRKQAVSVIKRGGEHLLSLIEGTLDMAHIESGKLTLNVKPMQFASGMHEMASMFELQAAAKGLSFRFEVQGSIPDWVRADEKTCAPDLFQPAGQRHQVHPDRRCDLALAVCPRNGAGGGGGHRPRHGAGGSGPHLRPLHPRRQRGGWYHRFGVWASPLPRC